MYHSMRVDYIQKINKQCIFFIVSGPKIQLIRLKVSELPDHTRTQIPSTLDPNCDPTDNTIDTSPVDQTKGTRFRGARRRGNRGRGRRPNDPSDVPTVKEPQSDTSAAGGMSMSENSENMKQHAMYGGQKHREPAAAAPVHESRNAPSDGSGVTQSLRPNMRLCSATVLMLAIFTVYLR